MRKLSILFFILVMLFSFTVLYAQSATEILNWTKTYLDNGDCEMAKKTYELYKEKVSEGNVEIERRIARCGANVDVKVKPKKYDIGDDASDLVHEGGYRIAYLNDYGGGFAIKIITSKNRYDWCFACPTVDECRKMYANRYTLGLYGECWTRQQDEDLMNLIWNIREVRYTYNFRTGKIRTRIENNFNSDIMKINIRCF